MLALEDPSDLLAQAVNPIIELIERQLHAVPGGCRDMLVVGGFAASPYLMQRLKKEFSARVSNIWQPPQSGSAILEGAVLYGASVSCTAQRAPGAEAADAQAFARRLFTRAAPA